MRADYRCTYCGVIGEVQHPANEPVFVVCLYDRQPAERYFSPWNVPYHQEDRRHMRGEKMSHVTGKPYAQSRTEERVIEKAGGFEFVTKSEMPESWKMLREHANYVKAGGTPVAPNVLNPPPDPRVEPGTILKMMDKKGLRFGSR